MQPEPQWKTPPGERPRLADQPDLYRLTVFHTVVNEGTMAKASEQLFISQPAISAHIKALEAELGVSLFDRVGRRSVVNSAGQLLYEKAARLFTVADELKGAMQDLRGVAVGHIRLGASMVWQYLLPQALGRFKRSYPHVELSSEVANSDRIERLVVDRSIDIGFIGRAASRADLVSKHLAQDEVVPICSPRHSLAEATDAAPGDLTNEAFVLREAGSATRCASDELLAGLGVTANVSMELGSQEAIQQAVMGGPLIGMVSRAGLGPALKAGTLAAAGVGPLTTTLRLHVIYLEQKTLTLTQRTFLDMIASDGELSRTRLRLISEVRQSDHLESEKGAQAQL